VVARLERPEVWSEWVRIARRGQQDEQRKVEVERGREELQAAGQAERRG
jgi:hypothetical protein